MTKHKAFFLASEANPVIRDVSTGNPTPGFHGICRVHFSSGMPCDFETWIDGSGERNWRYLAQAV